MREAQENALRISVATQDDVAELSELLQLLFAQESEFAPDPAIQQKALRAIVSGSDLGDIFVARRHGKVLGMASLLYTVSTALGDRVALLEDMVVSPAARNKGIGSALINQAISFARERGCKRITLLSDSDNEAAHRFYEQHGFRKSSMTPFRLLLEQE